MGPGSAQHPQKATFDLSDNATHGPVGSHGANNLPGHQSRLFSNGQQEEEEKEPRLHSCGSYGSDAQGANQMCSQDATAAFQLNGQDTEAASCDRKEAAPGAQPLGSGGLDSQNKSPLIPMTLYLHRVKGLVLALLVEPDFLNDSASMEEVVRTASVVTTSPAHIYLLCPLLFSLG